MNTEICPGIIEDINNRGNVLAVKKYIKHEILLARKNFMAETLPRPFLSEEEKAGVIHKCKKSIFDKDKEIEIKCNQDADFISYLTMTPGRIPYCKECALEEISIRLK